MSKVYEKTYGSYLGIQGAIEHFADDICGNELDTNISDEKINKLSELGDVFEGRWILENGIKLDVDISLLETEDIETKEIEYEWLCVARTGT